MPGLQKNILWCPGLDDEMRGFATYFLSLPDMFDHCLQGGQRKLDNFAPGVKLYILAHGHDSMPRFVTKAGSWSAEQLAHLLVNDGLSRDHQHIELLVCNAGQSVNTRKGAAKLMEINTQARRAQDRGEACKATKLEAKFEALATKQQKPRLFEEDPKAKNKKAERKAVEGLLLPMAAQLAQALKNRRFSRFYVVSYKCPVDTYADKRNGIFLDLGHGRVRAALHPEMQVVWR